MVILKILDIENSLQNHAVLSICSCENCWYAVICLCNLFVCHGIILRLILVIINLIMIMKDQKCTVEDSIMNIH